MKQSGDATEAEASSAQKSEAAAKRSVSEFIVENLLTTVDMYGQPIQFNYEGSTTFKSTIGGFLTILTYILIIVLMFFRFKGQEFSLNKEMKDVEVKYEGGNR